MSGGGVFAAAWDCAIACGVVHAIAPPRKMRLAVLNSSLKRNTPSPISILPRLLPSSRCYRRRAFFAGRSCGLKLLKSGIRQLDVPLVCVTVPLGCLEIEVEL